VKAAKAAKAMKAAKAVKPTTTYCCAVATPRSAVASDAAEAEARSEVRSGPTVRTSCTVARKAAGSGSARAATAVTAKVKAARAAGAAAEAETMRSLHTSAAGRKGCLPIETVFDCPTRRRPTLAR
jgi:hypothetical protein